MKVKNIAFSGIMAAILMGVSGANAAVEIASKQYVLNQVGDKATTAALESAQSTLQGAIDLKADKTALDATNEEVAKKANLSYVGTLETVNDTMPSSVVEYVKLKTAGIATDAALGDLGTRVTTAEGEIDTLQGTVGNADSGLVKDVAANAGAISALQTAVGETSVADQITAALGDYTKTETLEKDYLTKATAETTYEKIGVAKGLVDALSADGGAIKTLETTVAGHTTSIQSLQNDKADASTVTTLSETVAGLTNAENGIAATYATKTELKATDDKAVANAEAIADIEASDYATSGINAEKVTQIGTNTTAIATLNADAQTAGSVDNKIATAKATLLDKPVDNNCTAESGLCVLTLSKDGSKLVWIDVTDPADAE